MREAGFCFTDRGLFGQIGAGRLTLVRRAERTPLIGCLVPATKKIVFNARISPSLNIQSEFPSGLPYCPTM